MMGPLGTVRGTARPIISLGRRLSVPAESAFSAVENDDLGAVILGATPASPEFWSSEYEPNDIVSDQ